MVKAGYLFTAKEAATWCGGELLGASSSEVSGAEVDSRRCKNGVLFFALSGERVDGHNYIDAAVKAGAIGAVVSTEWSDTEDAVNVFRHTADDVFFIIVDNPLRALQRIAAEYLKGISGPVRVGITGSNGKTTTKELIASVLSEKYSVVKTAGNYNSEIGLPLTVFNIKNEHDYAVIEMGVNRLGEMDVLSEILRPDVVVITNIGTAHIGIFGNKDTIAEEKRHSVSRFDGDGTLFVAEDEPYAGFLAEGLKGRSIVYGRESLEADGGLNYKNLGLRGWAIEIDGEVIEYPLIGEHNLKNAFCACAVGRFAELGIKELKAGLESVNPLFGRGEIIEGAVTIIQDSYNANVDSMFTSMAFADNLDWSGSKYYVFGDMKELGSDSEKMHRQLGREAASCRADKVFFFGEDSVSAFEEAKQRAKESPVFFHTNEYKALEDELLLNLKPDDLLLLKGSRSMNLERLIEPVNMKFGREKC